MGIYIPSGGAARLPGGKQARIRKKSAAAQAGKPAAKLSAPGERARDTVRISCRDVQTAREGGYIEVNGEKVAVPEEMAGALAAVYEAAAARNELVRMRNEQTAARENTERMAKQMEKGSKALKQAMEIARRISKGGHVPPEDEEFLLQFSQAMYMAAKMEAMMAKKHEKYDTALEEEEAESGEAPAEPDNTGHSAEAQISGGTVTGVSAAVSGGGAE